MSDDVTFLRQLVRDSIEIKAQTEIDITDEVEIEMLEQMQVNS